MLNQQKMKIFLFLFLLSTVVLVGKERTCTNGHCYVKLEKINSKVVEKGTMWKSSNYFPSESQEDMLELIYDDGTIITVALKNEFRYKEQEMFIGLSPVEDFLSEVLKKREL